MFETTGIPDKVEPSHHLQALTDLLAPRDGDSESSGDVNGQHLNQSLISLCSHVCRICHHANGINEALISPCSCKGSLAYVHISCLERWLNQTCRNHCELCSYRFNVIETPRYRWRESLRIWMNYPPNRQHAQSDLIVFILLTVVVVGLTVVCLLGMKYFIIEGRKIGISRLWTRGAICFFLAIVILGYCFTVYLLVKEQVVPWYRWWKTEVNVRIVVESQLERGKVQTPGVIPGHRNAETTIGIN
ncbi:E3 ubiquitin-protein ligase MARCHF3-like isoform X2 [Chelonus insularis]|uniref:E3 ubiquitin-protein ligase MARCHF3-like isoform X2 n=1 Tax=Chelonus insularis TaxID=460826 RepID=UPI001588C9FA|nr:E3 ubiquitin-protein ligase MARCHF3-like isoform X2 [Chelonus insularis]